TITTVDPTGRAVTGVNVFIGDYEARVTPSAITAGRGGTPPRHHGPRPPAPAPPGPPRGPPPPPRVQHPPRAPPPPTTHPPPPLPRPRHQRRHRPRLRRRQEPRDQPDRRHPGDVLGEHSHHYPAGPERLGDGGAIPHDGHRHHDDQLDQARSLSRYRPAEVR